MLPVRSRPMDSTYEFDTSCALAVARQAEEDGGMRDFGLVSKGGLVRTWRRPTIHLGRVNSTTQGKWNSGDRFQRELY